MTGQRAPLAELSDFEKVLASSGYDCVVKPLGDVSRALVAENPYGILAIVETESWNGLAELLSEVQAELTYLVRDNDRSELRWDLYVMVHVRSRGLIRVDTEAIDRMESDTKFARKFVRVNLPRNQADLDQALRPFLPLRAPASLDTTDPLELVRLELQAQGIGAELAEVVVRTFAASGEISLP